MLEFLLSICEGDALLAIRDCRWHGDPNQGLSSALEILEGIYGFLGTDAVSSLGPIRKRPSVPMTKDGLQKFLVEILSCKTKVLNNFGDTQRLNDSDFLADLVKRLP